MNEEMEKRLLAQLSDEKVNAFFTSPIWQLLMGLWEDGRNVAVETLKHSPNVTEIHTFQGKTWVLDRDVALESLVRNRIDDIRKEQETEEKTEETTEA